MMVKGKRGQVTIFLIIALLIITLAVFLYFINFRDTIQTQTIYESPLRYMETCATEATQEAINDLLQTGGYSDPILYITYNNTKITYLCYNANYYYPCINQKPFLVKDIQKEIEDLINLKINECFSKIKEDQEKKGLSLEYSEEQNIRVELLDKKVAINIKKKFRYQEGDTTKTYDGFKAELNSPVYNMAEVAIELVNQEARFCSSEYLGYQMLYPWLKITKLDIEGTTKIYSIKDRKTQKQLNIAIRGCALRGGV